MKILLVINKSLQRGNISRIDGGYWNLYIPMLQLGHEVKFYDILNGEKDSFKDIVEKFKPNLIFCCLTFNSSFAKYESLSEIEQITKKGNIKTFNWFCDDTWRFDSISKKVCWNFTACSTPEPTYVQKYKDIGYNNILLGFWHTNEDIISLSNSKIHDIAFCGSLNHQRISLIDFIKKQNLKINNFFGVSQEDMLINYSSSKIGINFSKNENDPEKKTQMKARMVEIPACKSLLVTEYTPGIETFFDVNKEIICFKDEKEMIEKIKYLLNNDPLREKISNAGHQRFLKEHTSKIRIKKILDELEKV